MTVLLLLFLAIGDAVAVSSVTANAGSGWPVLALLLICTYVVLRVYTRTFHRGPFLAKPANPFEFHQVPADRAGSLREEVRKSDDLKPHEAMIFAAAVVRPEQFRRRIVEEYTPGRRTLEKSTTVDIDIPKRLVGKNNKEHVYLPVVINKKGDLLDDFHIYESNSDETQWLSYRQYLSLTAEVLHVLLLSAHRLPRGTDLPVSTGEAELLALQCIVHRHDTRSPAAPDFSGAEAIERLAVTNPGARDLAGLFVRQLSRNFAIVASVDGPVAKRHRFKYRLTLTPEVRLSGSAARRNRSPAGYLRLLVGARPVALHLDIANAATCESYHLHVHAPDDLYLARQETIGLDRVLLRQAEKAPTLPHCRFRRRLGQPHAHFYCRYLPALEDGERPLLRLRFFEVPPGTVMRATVTALAAFAILWLVGYVNSRTAAPDTDAPAFLLAFPALAATWLGFDAPSRKLLEGTLSARVCLIASAVLSLVGSALFLLHKTAAEGYGWPRVPGGHSLLGVTDLGWAITVAVALLNATRICYQCFIRTGEYSYLLTKNVN
ncbi:hypothetical protein [Actinosynnema sp. NPDC023587]|uniref:hypothetical protein n=1 Tax=Actinosynnema sp. NPDC023587 TaxID=3154695 RepID=UPI0033C991D6